MTIPIRYTSTCICVARGWLLVATLVTIVLRNLTLVPKMFVKKHCQVINASIQLGEHRSLPDGCKCYAIDQIAD